MENNGEKRRKNGKYLKGTKAGPGRPKGSVGTRRTREYLDAFRSAVTLEKWTIATEKLLDMAIKGNVKAYAELARYCMPQAAVVLATSQEIQEAFRFAGVGDKELAEKMAAEVLETFKVHHAA